jgi:hypothetical protein
VPGSGNFCVLTGTPIDTVIDLLERAGVHMTMRAVYCGEWNPQAAY